MRRVLLMRTPEPRFQIGRDGDWWRVAFIRNGQFCEVWVKTAKEAIAELSAAGYPPPPCFQLIEENT